MVSNLTVTEAHAEFSKLIDQISAIDEKLKSGHYGEAGFPQFISKLQELSPMYACV